MYIAMPVESARKPVNQNPDAAVGVMLLLTSAVFIIYLVNKGVVQIPQIKIPGVTPGGDSGGVGVTPKPPPFPGGSSGGVTGGDAGVGSGGGGIPPGQPAPISNRSIRNIYTINVFGLGPHATGSYDATVREAYKEIADAWNIYSQSILNSDKPEVNDWFKDNFWVPVADAQAGTRAIDIVQLKDIQDALQQYITYGKSLNASASRLRVLGR